MKKIMEVESELLPTAPTLAPEPTRRQLKASFRQGRRDAATTRPDERGHVPSTHTYSFNVDRIESLIHSSLVVAVEQIDAKLARIEAEVRTTNAAPVLPPATPHTLDSRDGSPEMQDSARMAEAAASKAIAANAANQGSLRKLSGDAADLVQRRERVHDEATAILQSWQAHATLLTAAHRAGYAKALGRRFPRPRITVPDLHLLPIPAHVATHGWAKGEQMAFTATVALPGQIPSLEGVDLPPVSR